MITEVLHEGRENATTARELAAAFRCDTRDITRQIQTERRAGSPILASVGTGAKGYFLPANEDEREQYHKSLQHRLDEMSATLAALTGTEKARRGIV